MPTNKGKSNAYDPIDVAKKYNITLEEAEKIVKDRKNKTNGSKETYIKRWGKEEGIRRYNIFVEKSKVTKENYIKRMGYEKGCIEWAKTKKKKDKFSLEYFITTFGEELGKIKFEETCNRNKQTLDSFTRKFGEIKGKIEYSKYCYKKTKHLREEKFWASKESIEFFQPIVEFVRKKGFYCNIGCGDSKELRLYSRNNRKNYYYDFALIKFKLIIEYDGPSHPTNNDDPKTWRCIFRGISYEEALTYDNEKQLCAEQCGYTVIRINHLEAKKNKLKLQRYIINLIRKLINENQIN